MALGTLRKDGLCAQAMALSLRRRRRFNPLDLLLGRSLLLQKPLLRVITSNVKGTHVQGGERTRSERCWETFTVTPCNDTTYGLNSCSLKTSKPSFLRVQKEKREREMEEKGPHIALKH